MFLNKMENIVLNETKYGWPSYTKTTEFKPYDTIGLFSGILQIRRDISDECGRKCEQLRRYFRT